MSVQDKHELVRKAYGSLAKEQSSRGSVGRSCCDGSATAPDLVVPEAELGVSCGNPVAFSHIEPGDVVVDLGSGAGKDVFLAAQQTGPTGRAIGVDMTPEMLDLARRNAEKFREATGLDNVEFREGRIEHLPLDDASVDLVISNCVINLSPDKPRVFREVHRVLKPGGKMVVSDIVLNRPLPESLKNDENLYAGCIAGALLREDYLRTIRDAGFETVTVLSDTLWTIRSSCCGADTGGNCDSLDGVASSITVMARK